MFCRTSTLHRELAALRREHALERAQFAIERGHLLDRIMVLADRPMYDWQTPQPAREAHEEDVVGLEEVGFDRNGMN